MRRSRRIERSELTKLIAPTITTMDSTWPAEDFALTSGDRFSIKRTNEKTGRARRRTSRRR